MDYNCPLLNKIIDSDYCYDIKMVVDKIIKPNAIEDTIDENKKHLCTECKYHKEY